MRAAPRPPRRLEFVVHAVWLIVLAVLSNAFVPTRPAVVWTLRAMLLAPAAWLLVKAVTGPTVGPWSRRYRVLRALVWAPGLVIVTVFMAFGAGLATAIISLNGSFIVWGAVGLSWLVLWQLARRGRFPGAVMRLWVTTSAFALAMVYYVGALWMWTPPSAETCSAIEAPEHVTRLTPQRYPDGLSYPYEMLWVPEREVLVASFKMAGNAVLDFWNRDSANRLVFLDLSDGLDAPALREEARPGQSMPEYLLYEPERDQLLVSYLAYGRHALELLDMSAFPEALPVLAKVELDAAPNALIPMRKWSAVAVFMQSGQRVEVRDWESLDRRRDHKMRLSIGYVPQWTMDAVAMPETDMVYAYIFGGKVAYTRLLERRERIGMPRSIDVDDTAGTFGAGEVAADARLDLVAQTSMITQNVALFRASTMEPLAVLDMGTQTRPVAFDRRRKLLLVGEWLGGRVHVFDVTTLQPVGEPIEVGPYLREIQVDPNAGRAFAGSKCGVYAVDLDAHVTSARGAAASPQQ